VRRICWWSVLFPFDPLAVVFIPESGGETPKSSFGEEERNDECCCWDWDWDAAADV
jgi:hypothetical protein